MQRRPPSFSTRLILRDNPTHIACIAQAGVVTSFLARARLTNPNANLSRVVAALVDIGIFLAIGNPNLTLEDYQSLDCSQSLHYFEESMSALSSWSLCIITTRTASNGDKTTYTSTLSDSDFTIETNLLIALARTHGHCISLILCDAIRLAISCTLRGDCSSLQGTLRTKVEHLALGNIFFPV